MEISNAHTITLCGFMGSGKSSLGKGVANSTGYIFIDLDHYIEAKYSCSISDFFKSNGEEKFREEEYTSLCEILETKRQGGVILSLGGGTLTNAKCRELIKSQSYCIYIRCSADALASRLIKNGCKNRPLLYGKSPDELKEVIKNSIESREPSYLECANKIFDIPDREPLIVSANRLIQIITEESSEDIE